MFNKNYIILPLLTIIFLYHVYFINYKTLSQSINLLKLNENEECLAVNNSIEQFRIQIDGIYYPNRVPLYHNRSINFECLNSSTNIKTILWWTKFNGLPFKNYGFGIRKPFLDMNCPVTNCELTNDRSKFNKSKLVLFHVRNNIDYIPKRAFNEQRYVHIIYESPVHCHLCTKYQNVFNLSSTFTTDSDFTSIYWTDSGLYYDLNQNFNHSFDYFTNKTNFSAALITNCYAQYSLRNEYLNELKKYIPLDIYGACGKPCPYSIDCRQFIADNYKFFFVFENSLCRDYMTEKIFDTLNYNIIPIVMGIGNYSFYIPKSAYINVLDFKSPKKLANYLLYLNNNKTAYNSYFKWKKYLKSDKTNKVTAGYLCEMCIQLNLEEKLKSSFISKQLDVNKTSGLYENCYIPSLENDIYYEIKKVDKNIFSYIVSSENKK